MKSVFTHRQQKPQSFTWATFPGPTLAPVGMYYISDVGINGSLWYNDGTKFRPAGPIIIGESYTPYTTSNGTANEKLYVSPKIPAGLLQIGTKLTCEYSISKSGTVEVASVNSRLGTAADGLLNTAICFSSGIAAGNRNFANIRTNIIASATSITEVTAQSGSPYTGTGNVGTIPTTISNISNDMYYSLTCTKTTGGIETLTLNSVVLTLQ